MLAFQLPGGFGIYGFPLALGIGLLIGFAWLAILYNPWALIWFLRASLALLVGALIGGRLVFCALNWEYFRQHPLEIALLGEGGYAWPGALLGALAFFWIYAKFDDLNVSSIYYHLLPLIATFITAAWLGAWWDGIAYGAKTNAWWGLMARDEWGLVSRRVPVQVLGALGVLALFWAIEWQKTRHLSVQLTAGLALTGFGLLMFALSQLRADPALYVGNLRLDTWFALVLAAAAGLYSLWQAICLWQETNDT